MTLKQTVVTGCKSSDAIYENRLLIIAPSPLDTLITCGSCDGYCESRNLINISADVVTHDKADTQRVVETASVPTFGVVSNGLDWTSDGVGSLDSRPKLYLFTGVSYSPDDTWAETYLKA